MLKHKRLISLLAALPLLGAQAQNTVIDIRNGNGNNSADNYITYSTTVSVAAGKTTDVKLARYCYLTSAVSGKGTINLYAGGERCYLGTKSGASWALDQLHGRCTYLSVQGEQLFGDYL